MNQEHKQVYCQGIPIDELLAPLIVKLWDYNINTLYSCQGNPIYECDAYISFRSVSDAIKFLNITKTPDPIELQIVYDNNGTKEFINRDELLIKENIPHIRCIIRFQTSDITYMTRNIT